MSGFSDVKLWMQMAGQHCPDHPEAIPPSQVRRLRKRLMEEELKELLDAMQTADIVEVADGVADLLYVTYGTAVSYGINADAAFSEAHYSNMSKFGADGKAILDEGGKVMKGPLYRPPDMLRVVTRGW